MEERIRVQERRHVFRRLLIERHWNATKVKEFELQLVARTQKEVNDKNRKIKNIQVVTDVTTRPNGTNTGQYLGVLECAVYVCVNILFNIPSLMLKPRKSKIFEHIVTARKPNHGLNRSEPRLTVISRRASFYQSRRGGYLK
jgi:hypothetical protein